MTSGFPDRLADTLRNDAPVHSLWYDLRTQALFEESFRGAVIESDALLQDRVWRVVSRYAELEGRAPAQPPEAAYALLDGLFLVALLSQAAGDGTAAERLQGQVAHLMSSLWGQGLH